MKLNQYFNVKNNFKYLLLVFIFMKMGILNVKIML